jgi:hypothetical protein
VDAKEMFISIEEETTIVNVDRVINHNKPSRVGDGPMNIDSISAGSA